MSDIIKTESIAKNIANTNSVLLEETADTALRLELQIHSGGVRGKLIRFKKNRNQAYERIPRDDFRKLKTFEGSHIELGTKQLLMLIEEVKKRTEISKDGIQNGENSYLVLPSNNSDDIRELVSTIIKKGHGVEFLSKFLDSSEQEVVDRVLAGYSDSKKKKVR